MDRTVAREPPNGPSGTRAEWRVNSRPAAGNCAGAALPTPSIQIPKGGAALWAAEPKTKGTTFVVPFVLVDLIGFEPTTPTMRM